MQTLVVFLLLSVVNARLSDDKCKEYSKKPLVYGFSLVNDFPHMGLLGFTKHNKTRYMCPSALIDTSIAITRANCVTNPGWPPKSGLFGMSNPDEKGVNYKLVDVVETIIHPRYSQQNDLVIHNIALVKFSPPITPNDYIRPGCLYTKNVKDGQILVDLLWGRADEDKGSFKVNSSVVSTASCQESYDKLKIINPQSDLCLNRNFNKKIRLHSGGASHVYEDGLPKIAAVDSFSAILINPEIPNVSSKIYFYLDWIEQNAWGKDKAV